MPLSGYIPAVESHTAAVCRGNRIRGGVLPGRRDQDSVTKLSKPQKKTDAALKVETRFGRDRKQEQKDQ